MKALRGIILWDLSVCRLIKALELDDGGFETTEADLAAVAQAISLP
jgi:hypothetical protein